MDILKKKFIEKAQPVIEELAQLRKGHGDKVVAEVTIEQIVSGMKGIPALLTLTSKLDPYEGIRFRGYSIPELQDLLPKGLNGDEPLPEGLFYLMLMDELPTEEDVEEIRKQWMQRAYIPPHVYSVLDATPVNTESMAQLSIAIVAWAHYSKFQKAYRTGASKKDLWGAMYEDIMDFIGGLPIVAAYIYRRTFRDGSIIPPDSSLDWAANYAHMMGFDSEEVKRLFRLYLFLHADHEGGNVSAHTTHLVGSALSDPFYSYAAGMLGLAGPLHGYANQEVMYWIEDMFKELGTDRPTGEQIEAFCHKTISEGRVIPGYGHAVLRKTDPRYIAQKEFADKYVKDDKYINVANKFFEIVPPVLGSLGKVKNPWPNVDAYSGSLLQHFGIKEYDYYTLMFGVSRALGIMASLLWDRVLGLPLERPSSFTLDWFKEKAKD